MTILQINKNKDTIELGPKVDGEYPVLGSSLAQGDLSLVIDPEGCASDVVNLDTHSDWADCFGLSCLVEVDGCVIGTSSMKAKNLDLLQIALKKVKFIACDPDEI